MSSVCFRSRCGLLQTDQAEKATGESSGSTDDKSGHQQNASV